jgi:hypothetical protein
MRAEDSGIESFCPSGRRFGVVVGGVPYPGPFCKWFGMLGLKIGVAAKYSLQTG